MRIVSDMTTVHLLDKRQFSVSLGIVLLLACYLLADSNAGFFSVLLFTSVIDDTNNSCYFYLCLTGSLLCCLFKFTPCFEIRL